MMPTPSVENESARQVQSVQRDGHALAGLDYSALRHADVVHDNFGGVRQPEAHLVLMGACRKTGRVAVDQKRRDAVATSLGIGLGEDDVDRRNRAIRDEALRAVEHILVTIEHSRGLHAGNVGASVGLGQAERRETVVDGFVDEVLSLLGGALQVNVAECDEVRDERISVSPRRPLASSSNIMAHVS